MSEREGLKHDLAHTLGMTVQQLSASMTEREFRRWMVYARERIMPSRRLEYGLAMVSLVVARVMGGDTSHSLQDFMVGMSKQEKKESADEFVAASGVKFFKLGQRRKKKG